MLLFFKSNLFPKPLIEHERDSALFRLYKCKNLYEKEWANQYLKSAIAATRKSYLRYGNVPIFDKYDEKAVVYLVRVSYKNLPDNEDAEEWLSMRFVPADGNPTGTADFDECLFGGRPAIKYLDNISVFKGEKNILSKIIAISKICGGFNGYKKNTDPQKIITENVKLKYTSVSFALTNKSFLEELGELNLPFSYVTGLFRNELIQKALTTQTEKGILPTFVPAHKTLKLNPEDVCLNRKASAYRFPTYFLKAEEIISAIRKMLNQGKISVDTINFYLGLEIDIRELNIDTIAIHKMPGIKNLGNLLSVKGKIHGASITGEELRNFLDEQVSDGAELKIMELESWRKDIEAIV